MFSFPPEQTYTHKVEIPIGEVNSRATLAEEERRLKPGRRRFIFSAANNPPTPRLELKPRCPTQRNGEAENGLTCSFRTSSRN
jgi:hypothetical protein